MPRSNKPNTSSDHFISLVAHHLEEATSALHALIVAEDDQPGEEALLPKGELVRVKILHDHLCRAYAREAKRQGQSEIAREVLKSLRLHSSSD